MAASWLCVKLRAGLSQVIENGQGKGIVQVQVKVREFYFESGKIDILKETLKLKLHGFNTTDGWKKHFE